MWIAVLRQNGRSTVSKMITKPHVCLIINRTGSVFAPGYCNNMFPQTPQTFFFIFLSYNIVKDVSLRTRTCCYESTRSLGSYNSPVYLDIFFINGNYEEHVWGLKHQTGSCRSLPPLGIPLINGYPS